jgi:hypothetical protein
MRFGTLQLDLELVEGPPFFFSELDIEIIVLEVGLMLREGVSLGEEQGVVGYTLHSSTEIDETLVEFVQVVVFVLNLLDVLLDLLFVGHLVYDYLL